MTRFTPLPHEGDRGEHMVHRVGRTAREVGVDTAEVDLLDALHRHAMARRRGEILDDHDPAFLHPGRTALVLLGDAGAREVDVLAAGLLVDTERPELAPSRAGLADRLGVDGRPALLLAAAGELADAVPLPTAEDLAEALVTAPERVRLVALSERLDQLRHVHLRDDPGGARAALESARRVYLPVAERTHPVLARRYAWWCRTFARRRG